jgi:hypothetical protein
MIWLPANFHDVGKADFAASIMPRADGLGDEKHASIAAHCRHEVEKLREKPQKG